MKQADIAYCIKHASFVNGLWDKRGKQVGDWYTFADRGRYSWLVWEGNNPPIINDDTAIWIPTEGDALWFLDEAKRDVIEVGRVGAWHDRPASERFRASVVGKTTGPGYGATRLIALLELLRAVEGKG